MNAVGEPQVISTDDGQQITVAGHVRIERRGRTTRMYIDGTLFPWATSPDVEKQITDVQGVMCDVTIAIRASSAEIVDLDRTPVGPEDLDR